MSSSLHKDNANENKKTTQTLFVSFAGHDKMFGQIQRFEFINFFNKYFNKIDRHFYIDVHTNSYHNGIEGISTNIDETVEYLRKDIENYKNVVFFGVSSGGYAAILFGSLLNIQSVVAFIPQTIRRSKIVDEKYRDISLYINNTTRYFLYGDTSISDSQHMHHISHCERIAHHSNVYLTKKEKFNLKEMRDSGELYKIIYHVLTR